MTPSGPKSSIILLKTQSPFDVPLQIEMTSVGNIEPFTDPPDQGISVHSPAGNKIGGGKIQMHLDFRDPANRMVQIHSREIQTTVFCVVKRNIQPQQLIAEAEGPIKLRTEIHRIRNKITQFFIRNQIGRIIRQQTAEMKLTRPENLPEIIFAAVP